MYESHGNLTFVTLVRLIVSVTLSIISGSVLAERAPMWEKDYKVLVPADVAGGREAALKRAMDEVRVRAAAEFGSAVLTTDELSDGDLARRTRVVTAGVVAINLVEEGQEGGAGSAMTRFVLRARIPSDELERQLQALRTDAARDQRLRTLARENEVLRARGGLSSGVPAKGREVVLADLLRAAEVQTRPQIVFQSGGLGNAAMANDRPDSTWASIEKALFEPLRNAAYEMEFAGAEQVDRAVTLKMTVRWKLDLSYMRAKSMEFARDYIALPGAQYKDGFCVDVRNTPTRTHDALMSEAVWLEVAVGGSRDRFMIAGPVDSYWCVAAANTAAKTLSVKVAGEDASKAGSIEGKVVRGNAPEPFKPASLRADLMRSTFLR